MMIKLDQLPPANRVRDYLPPEDPPLDEGGDGDDGGGDDGDEDMTLPGCVFVCLVLFFIATCFLYGGAWVLRGAWEILTGQ